MISLKVENFLKQHIREKISQIEPITNSGSNRLYYRVFTNTNSFILTISSNIEENQSFVYFANVFKNLQIHVPALIAANEDFTAYLQEDIGNEALLDKLIAENYSENSFQLYKNSLSELAYLQIKTKDNIDYNLCYDFKKFDKHIVLNDLFYFKDFFVERLNVPYSKNLLISEFFNLADAVSNFDNSYFLYRDFQARNIFVKQNQPYFIDFQGGMQGFLGYDLVSLIFQAKANLPKTWQKQLKDYYANYFIEKGLISTKQFDVQYNYSLILRFLQLLGAYGLRGLVEKKPHFLESIVHHYKNLEILLNKNLLDNYSETKKIIQFIVSVEGKKHINQLFQNNKIS